jgi:hypothetical protein
VTREKQRCIVSRAPYSLYRRTHVAAGQVRLRDGVHCSCTAFEPPFFTVLTFVAVLMVRSSDRFTMLQRELSPVSLASPKLINGYAEYFQGNLNVRPPSCLPLEIPGPQTPVSTCFITTTNPFARYHGKKIGKESAFLLQDPSDGPWRVQEERVLEWHYAQCLVYGRGFATWLRERESVA